MLSNLFLLAPLATCALSVDMMDAGNQVGLDPDITHTGLLAKEVCPAQLSASINTWTLLTSRTLASASDFNSDNWYLLSQANNKKDIKNESKKNGGKPNPGEGKKILPSCNDVAPPDPCRED
jgi:hypothetical protein